MNLGKTCAIICPMGFNESDFLGNLNKGAFSAVLACDGGYRHVQALMSRGYDLGRVEALGDFDSLGFVPDALQAMVFDSHKDASDLELALSWAQGQGFEAVRLYGAMGGRPDHQWAVYAAMVRFAESGRSVTAVGFDPDAHAQMCAIPLVGPGEMRIPAPPGALVSVFSFGDESSGVCEWGMEYPLQDACLTNRQTLGLSNVSRCESPCVALREGCLLVFYELLRQGPDGVMPEAPDA